MLEENIDLNKMNAALKELEMYPALMGSLTAVQFVKDALRGNPCLDKGYSAGIMQFIAVAEAKRMADESV